MGETCAGTLASAVMTEVSQVFLMTPLIPLVGFYLEDLLLSFFLRNEGENQSYLYAV